MNSIHSTFYAHIFQNSRRQKGDMMLVQYCGPTNIRHYLLLLLLLSVGLPVANAPDVLQPCGLLYYP